MALYLKLLLQLFLAPQRGWEDMAAVTISPETMVKRGFIPLAALASLTSFIALVFHPAIEVLALIFKTLMQFVALLAGYYIAILIITAYRPMISNPGREASDRNVRLFALGMMGLMALVGLISNCLPSDFDIVYFLYVYLGIVAWRGKGILAVAHDKTVSFVILAVIATIIPPLLIMMI